MINKCGKTTIRLGKKEGKYSCDACDCDFTDKFKLVEHLLSKHSDYLKLHGELFDKLII